MRRAHPQLVAVIAAALLSFYALAETAPINVDDLPHKMIMIGNSRQVWVIEHERHNWRVVELTALTETDIRDPDICFEAKYDSFAAPDKIKLFGSPIDITIFADERLKRRAQNELKRGDNLWFCGTLKKASGKSFAFQTTDILKLPPDVQRFTTRIAALQKASEYEALIELGQRIEVQRKAEFRPFTEDQQMGLLRDEAFDKGLTLKELALKESDADGFFSLALQWKGLRKKGSKYRELVLKCLKINPDHPEAGRIAQDELGMVKFEDFGWISQEKKVSILEQREIDKKRQDQAARDLMESKARDRARAIANRAELLVSSQARLRSADQKERERAIEALGEAIRTTIDPGFGEEGIDILANLDDSSVVSPGLEKAVQSELPEIRRQVFEALAWKLSQHQGKAVDVLAAALAAEKDVPTVKIGVEALVSSGGKSAVKTLIGSLGNDERGARDEIAEGLRLLTKQSLPNKEAWENWYSKNSASLGPN